MVKQDNNFAQLGKVLRNITQIIQHGFLLRSTVVTVRDVVPFSVQLI